MMMRACVRRDLKQKLHVVQFKLSIALKLLSVFLFKSSHTGRAPAGEVIQYVPAAVLIRPQPHVNAVFAIWTATTKIWRGPVQRLHGSLSGWH